MSTQPNNLRRTKQATAKRKKKRDAPADKSNTSASRRRNPTDESFEEAHQRMWKAVYESHHKQAQP